MIITPNTVNIREEERKRRTNRAIIELIKSFCQFLFMAAMSLTIIFLAKLIPWLIFVFVILLIFIW
jgi:hypothetical protein